MWCGKQRLLLPSQPTPGKNVQTETALDKEIMKIVHREDATQKSQLATVQTEAPRPRGDPTMHPQRYQLRRPSLGNSRCRLRLCSLHSTMDIRQGTEMGELTAMATVDRRL